MTSGNLSDSKAVILLLKKVYHLCDVQFTIGLLDEGYDYETIYDSFTRKKCGQSFRIMSEMEVNL